MRGWPPVYCSQRKPSMFASPTTLLNMTLLHFLKGSSHPLDALKPCSSTSLAIIPAWTLITGPLQSIWVARASCIHVMSCCSVLGNDDAFRVIDSLLALQDSNSSNHVLSVLVATPYFLATSLFLPPASNSRMRRYLNSMGRCCQWIPCWLEDAWMMPC